MARPEAAPVEVVAPAAHVAGELRVPGDKSIAHRALILGAMADGESSITGLPDGRDVAATMACLRSLGVDIREEDGAVRLRGAGLGSWSPPKGILDCMNSGTTMRLLLGALAGSRIGATLDGDESLRQRPMRRVIEPLTAMGAGIESRDGRAPVSIHGRPLMGQRHSLTVPSAQVKSAILLAGLCARGRTAVLEPVSTRDHTERLLRAMGAPVTQAAGAVEIEPVDSLRPFQLSIPGDVSSAAFYLAAAALRPGWSITVHEVGLNPTRTSFLTMLRSMGASVQIEPRASEDAEPRGTVTVRGAGLRPVVIGASDVAGAIDEIPALLAVATQAEGSTEVRDAAELRVKESDRIAAMAEGLRRMGALAEERPDGVSIAGPTKLRGASIDSRGDHRIAMALAVAALTASGPTHIENAASVAVSYPGFFARLREVTGVS